MDGVDIEQFVSAQRGKLNQEKARLFEDQRSTRGIIPSGSQMTTRSERLRHERQSEYKDFLKMREKAPKSVADMRREMSREREQEIGSQGVAERDTDRQMQGQSSYNSLKSQRLEEERQYRGATYDHEREEGPRRQWNEGPSSQQRVRFEENGRNRLTNGGYSRGWEDDEQELMSWARGRGQGSKSRHVRARTPPEVQSPRSKVNHSVHTSVKMRSISAPVVHDSSGIPGLGGRAEDSAETRRNKQKEYAETLRAQIREREEAKQREKVKEELQDVDDTEENRPTQRKERNVEKRQDRKPAQDVKKEYHPKERSPPHHSEHERYPPYRPPPSHFNDHPHYGPSYKWGAQYYPYYPPQPPPRNAHDFDYYPPDPYHNPYYQPSYRFPPPAHPPHGENPYFPPRHEMRRSPPRRHHWDDDDDNYRDEYSLRTRKRDYKDEFETRRRNRDISSRERRENTEYSQLSGGGGERGRGTPMDKAAYRAELTRQMKEKKEKELKARLKREMEDSKETEVYDPFGKGGCGAPVRDQHGNLVADLKQMRKLNEERLNLSTSPSHHPASDGEEKPNDSPRTVFTYDKVDEETKKHSAHMTYRDFLKQQVEEKEKKKEIEKKQQMLEEQRELDRLEKDRKKLEDDFKRERERERQREEEAKRKNEQMKREAEDKKREAARKAEEEQRREAERERQLADAKLSALAEKMAQPLPERRTYSPPIPTLRNKTVEQSVNPPQALSIPPEQPPTFRSFSPPVPAVLKKMTVEEKQTTSQTESGVQLSSSQAPPRALAGSPPLQSKQNSSHSQLPHPPPHAPRRDQGGQEYSFPPVTSTYRIQPAAPTTTTDQPSDILKQLAAMRMHLQSELAKKDGLRRPEHAGVFEKAQQQKPKVPVPRIARPKDSAVRTALNQFTHLKYANPARSDFVSKYPEPPDTGSVLELQQDALLRHQEQQLARMKERERGNNPNPAAVLRYRQNLLDDPLASDSVNLPLGNRNDLFVDSTASLTSQDHMTASMATGPGGRGAVPSSRVHPQAKPAGRRHPWGDGRGTRVPSAGGQSQFSVTTFDVDSMAVRNDERARRLDAILNAGGSSQPQEAQEHHLHHHRHHQQQDPQTILHDFLRRTDHGASRQSEHSLDCETNFQRISSPHS